MRIRFGVNNHPSFTSSRRRRSPAMRDSGYGRTTRIEDCLDRVASDAVAVREAAQKELVWHACVRFNDQAAKMLQGYPRLQQDVTDLLLEASRRLSLSL